MSSPSRIRLSIEFPESSRFRSTRKPDSLSHQRYARFCGRILTSCSSARSAIAKPLLSRFKLHSRVTSYSQRSTPTTHAAPSLDSLTSASIAQSSPVLSRELLHSVLSENCAATAELSRTRVLRCDCARPYRRTQWCTRQSGARAARCPAIAADSQSPRSSFPMPSSSARLHPEYLLTILSQQPAARVRDRYGILE